MSTACAWRSISSAVTRRVFIWINATIAAGWQSWRAARAYKDINLTALRLLAPGGLLMTYSCSGGIPPELFQKIVAGAARDAGRTVRIIQRLQGAADHPVDLAFPEGEYLKGLLLQV